VRVLSGGERTRLAVARMLLRPSNTLLLDEPTNHLDLDSKEVLLDALVDYGGTLVFVSHDRYFVERLATRIVEVGDGTAVSYPGTYKEFLWHKQHGQEGREGQERHRQDGRERRNGREARPVHTAVYRAENQNAEQRRPIPQQAHAEKKRVDAEARKRQRAEQARLSAIEKLEEHIAECERTIKDLEQQMAAPGFYEDRTGAQRVIDQHQSLMWKVGDLMHQWEELQTGSPSAARG
jgi:ATP-binding cassette, subfamily F, member 3